MASPPLHTPVELSDHSSQPPSVSSSSHKKVFSLSSISKNSSLHPDKAVTEAEKLSKTRGLLGKLSPTSKKASSNSLSDSSENSTIVTAPTEISSTREPLKVDVKQSSSYTIASASEAKKEKGSDLFHQAVASAQLAVNHLSTVNTVLKGVAAGLALGAGWMPGVGQGVDLIVAMLDQAQQIAVGKVVALRLVSPSCCQLISEKQRYTRRDRDNFYLCITLFTAFRWSGPRRYLLRSSKR